MKSYTISPLFGAIIGDIAGSFYEGRTPRKRDFKLFTKHSRFTDDTVLTLAIAECISIDDTLSDNSENILKKYAKLYPDAGYGDMFWAWVKSDDSTPFDSNGNGAAMRTSPLAWASREYASYLAEQFSLLTHSNKEAWEGAAIITDAIQFAAVGEKANLDIALFQSYPEWFGHKINRLTVEQHRDARDKLSFDCSAKATIPQAIAAFMESTDFESAIRNAIWIGGDTDTVASMAGAIAIAYYNIVPDWMYIEAVNRLDPFLLDTIRRFDKCLEKRKLPCKILVSS